MFNKCLIYLFNCTCLNVMCVCSTINGSIQKDFWSFYMFLEVIFITLCVYVWYLLCFSLFKHVLCWKTGVKVFRNSLATCENFYDSSCDLQVMQCKSQVHLEAFATHLATRKNFRDSPNAKCPEIAFHGKFVLNLSHPLLNPFFNIFTSKSNQFECFFIPLTSLR